MDVLSLSSDLALELDESSCFGLRSQRLVHLIGRIKNVIVHLCDSRKSVCVSVLTTETV